MTRYKGHYPVDAFLCLLVCFLTGVKLSSKFNIVPSLIYVCFSLHIYIHTYRYICVYKFQWIFLLYFFASFLPCYRFSAIAKHLLSHTSDTKPQNLLLNKKPQRKNSQQRVAKALKCCKLLQFWFCHRLGNPFTKKAQQNYSIYITSKYIFYAYNIEYINIY